jgi:hypothetical protein
MDPTSAGVDHTAVRPWMALPYWSTGLGVNVIDDPAAAIGATGSMLSPANGSGVTVIVATATWDARQRTACP